MCLNDHIKPVLPARSADALRLRTSALVQYRSFFNVKMLRSGTVIALLALIPAACARLQPSQKCRKLHAGGANAFSDWQRQFSKDAPITFALTASHLMTFVASTRPRLRQAIVGHAVCCRRALQMRRFHALVAHSTVTGTPSQLGFGLLALYLVAKPVETSAGSQRFARFALASVIMGGCATAVSQSLGASVAVWKSTSEVGARTRREI